MPRIVVAQFDTQGEADAAVGHLVREHEIDPVDIVVKPSQARRRVGVRIAGTDGEAGHPGAAIDGNPEESSPYLVSVECTDDQWTGVQSALEGAGATVVGVDDA